jgi:hypothetical protein
LVTLVNQLDNQQKKNAKRCLFVVHVALQRRPHLPQDKAEAVFAQ